MQCFGDSRKGQNLSAPHPHFYYLLPLRRVLACALTCRPNSIPTLPLRHSRSSISVVAHSILLITVSPFLFLKSQSQIHQILYCVPQRKTAFHGTQASTTVFPTLAKRCCKSILAKHTQGSPISQASLSEPYLLNDPVLAMSAHSCPSYYRRAVNFDLVRVWYITTAHFEDRTFKAFTMDQTAHRL